LEEEREVKKGLNRREFMRRAALTGAAAAWAAPVIQTVAASPAYATTPVDWSDCVGGCNAAGPGCPPSGADAPALNNTACETVCTDLCGGPGGICCNSAVINSNNWCSTSGTNSVACYFGPLGGCTPSDTASCCGGTNNAVCATSSGPGTGTIVTDCQCAV
jgi:hypothetical protein